MQRVYKVLQEAQAQLVIVVYKETQVEPVKLVQPVILV